MPNVRILEYVKMFFRAAFQERHLLRRLARYAICHLVNQSLLVLCKQNDPGHLPKLK